MTDPAKTAEAAARELVPEVRRAIAAMKKFGPSARMFRQDNSVEDAWRILGEYAAAILADYDVSTGAKATGERKEEE